MEKEKDNRFDAELYVKVKPNSSPLTCWGILCDFSENSLSIISVWHVEMGAAMDMEIFMPDLSSCILKGTVNRDIQLPEPDRRFYIGGEISGKNVTYDYVLKFQVGQDNNTYAKTMRGFF